MFEQKAKEDLLPRNQAFVLVTSSEESLQVSPVTQLTVSHSTSL